ncbi:MAG TPA: DNA polymerase/3'-5' exonuclease PolX [Streptosporangiaceae bacterium]|nr:DNA polymerase/3'-5' exonuclease PolX [Streptosporangiaceae bacterium]
MPQSNDQAAALLDEYADLVALTGGDPFRARVYTKAARAIGAHPHDVAGLPLSALLGIPGVGKSIAAKVVEITGTGTFAELEDLRADIPDGVRQLTRIPALGPRRALQLYRELSVSSPDELRTAIAAGRLNDLRGFGPKSAGKLVRGLDLLATTATRVLLNVAAETAAAVIDVVGPVPGCERIATAGSLRRAAESIGDVDVLAAAADSTPLMMALRAMPEAAEVIGSGPAKTSIRTVAGLQVDLRVVPPDCWGAALQYFTGSQRHNVALRELAVRSKLKLSEYGLFDVESGELIVSRTEEEVYERLGLAWIPPVLREDTGEVAAARRGELPVLVGEADVRGDLHTHTNLTDGVATLAEMVAAATARGFEYYAITDHAPNLVMQRMTDEKMLAQRQQVRELGRQLAGQSPHRTSMTLLHGTELNIGPDGSVDWPAEFLAGFDICVASVHSHFDMPRREMTRRFIAACENPYVNVIGHPLTRKIGRRPPVDVDLPELFRTCARTGTALEVNAHPARLDLPSAHIKVARDAGVKFAIDSDAHSLRDLDYLKYGVATAQRGWLTADDVVNTWPLPRLTEFLGKGSVRTGAGRSGK